MGVRSLAAKKASRRTVRRHDAGISLIELIVVIGVLAIALSLTAILGRAIAQRASERSTVNTVQQAVWQGATLSAARGFRTELARVEGELQIRRLADGDILRRFELDRNASVNFDGQVLVFTPPGSITPESLEALRDLDGGGIRITAGGATYTLEVSLIGEVRVE